MEGLISHGVREGEEEEGLRRGQESGGQLPCLAMCAQREDGHLGLILVLCAIAQLSGRSDGNNHSVLQTKP